MPPVKIPFMWSAKDLLARIEARTKSLGLSDADVGRIAEKPDLMKNIRTAARQNRTYEPRAGTMKALARALRVQESWLTAIDDEARQPPDEVAVSSVDDEIGRSASANILEIDVRAGAGGGGIRIDDVVVYDDAGNSYAAENVAGEWTLPAAVLSGVLKSTPKHIKVFEIMGDSMEPRLFEGDRVFVDTRYTAPHPEGIFVLWDGYSIVVKGLQIVRGTDPLRVTIISENRRYPPYETTIDEIKIIGRYAGRFTTR
jgi:phage repressor protein C with HTH and peptisase S24 domain